MENSPSGASTVEAYLGQLIKGSGSRTVAGLIGLLSPLPSVVLASIPADFGRFALEFQAMVCSSMGKGHKPRNDQAFCRNAYRVFPLRSALLVA